MALSKVLPSAVATLTFFTGSDANMLPQFFILLQSLRETAPDADLVFCDFGLTPPQRRFLERRCKVATISAAPKSRPHPWLRKGSLVDFVGEAPEATVWIDADMLLLGDSRDELAAIIDDMAAKNELRRLVRLPRTGQGRWRRLSNCPPG